MLINYTGSKSGAIKALRLINTFICTAVCFFLCSGIGKAQGAVTFDPPVSNQITNASFPNLEPWGIALLDLEGDGDLDIATVARTTIAGCVAILQNDGTGAFTLVTNLPISTQPYRIIAADQNNDGFPDLISVNTSDPYGSGNTISLWLNDGLGNFGPRADHVVRDGVGAAISEDFNQDGIRDVATASGSGTTLLLGIGNGVLGPTNHVSGLGSSIVSGDFDEDGLVDIITGANSIRIFFLKGTGTGAFEPFQVVGTNSYAVSIISADLNKDGHLDLVVSSRIGLNVFFAGNGDGTFQSPVELRFDGFSNRLTLADLNGDGWIDPVFSYTSIKTFLGSENGEFKRQDIAAHGDFTGDLKSGDLDGDGRPDLVSAASNAGVVHVYFNRSLPALNIHKSPNILSWPTWPNYSLEYSDNLPNGQWFPEATIPTVQDGVNTLEFSVGNTNRFWRLRMNE